MRIVHTTAWPKLDHRCDGLGGEVRRDLGWNRRRTRTGDQMPCGLCDIVFEFRPGTPPPMRGGGNDDGSGSDDGEPADSP